MAKCDSRRGNLEHKFVRKQGAEVDTCQYCGITYRDAMYGAGTNATGHEMPPRVKTYGHRRARRT